MLKSFYKYISKAYKAMKIAKYVEYVFVALKDFFF